ncbi:tripartite tricarboxylate transporter permease [Halovivax gelatinilyticus]|uniref:tripartite tricarboxylate transporter permease n=1 Tax=Halovivax gelatinilyticus TaxID=2961597 RepID=UPI0020CA32AC|nr:tripartite tricarboxylate transporter permease [Halovivax gelatinilyticus]
MGTVELVVDPSLSVQLLAWTVAGSALGSITGLIPGLHANNFALLLAGVAASIPGPPLLVGAAMLAAGVVHTFVNAIPAMALGVPDAEMALTALPGHRLVLEGRGHEAIRLSALGSVLAILVAVPLAVPLTWAVARWYPVVIDHIAIILLGVVLALVVSERTPRRMVGGVLSVTLASALGIIALDIEPEAPLDAGGVLAPLFAGLFGAPVLLDAMRGGGVPPQGDSLLRVSRPALAVTAIAGTVAGAIVGYLPGISAAIAAVAVLVVLPGGEGGIGDTDDRSYIVATSGVDTANTIFALFALWSIGQPRTGVMVAFDSTGASLSLPVLILSVLIAGVFGFLVVIAAGDRYLTLVGSVAYWKISVVVLCLLAALSFLFAGELGILIFAVASAIGFVPVRFRARRVHLMGVLIGPLILATW